MTKAVYEYYKNTDSEPHWCLEFVIPTDFVDITSTPDQKSSDALGREHKRSSVSPSTDFALFKVPLYKTNLGN